MVKLKGNASETVPPCSTIGTGTAWTIMGEGVSGWPRSIHLTLQYSRHEQCCVRDTSIRCEGPLVVKLKGNARETAPPWSTIGTGTAWTI